MNRIIRKLKVCFKHKDTLCDTAISCIDCKTVYDTIEQTTDPRDNSSTFTFKSTKGYKKGEPVYFKDVQESMKVFIDEAEDISPEYLEKINILRAAGGWTHT